MLTVMSEPRKRHEYHAVTAESAEAVNTPGKSILIPGHRDDLSGTRQVIDKLRIDCVDALLAELADEVSTQCDFRPSLPIATFDTSDFTTMGRKHGLRLSLFDLRTFEEYELG